MKISIIFPCYSESSTIINESLRLIKNYFKDKNIEWEIIVSQNGGGKKLRFTDKKIKLVYTKQKGLGIGIKNSFKLVKYEYFYISSPDLPFQFSDLNQMITKRKEYDLIIGSKLHKDSIYEIKKTRKILSIINSLFLLIFLPKLGVRDPNGSLFGKTRNIKDILSSIKSDDYFFLTELLVEAKKKNNVINEVPIIYIKNNKNTSVNIIVDSIKFIKNYLIK